MYYVGNTRVKKAGILENLKNRVNLYPITISVRITEEMYAELPKIAAFEQIKPATLCRQELLKMVRRYQRTPQYKSWLKRTEKAFKE